MAARRPALGREPGRYRWGNDRPVRRHSGLDPESIAAVFIETSQAVFMDPDFRQDDGF